MSCEQVVNILYNLKKPEQISEQDKFMNSYHEIENDIYTTMLNAEATSKIKGSVLLYEINSKYNIRSDIATKLSEKYPEKLVIVYEKTGKRMNGSVRSNTEKYNVNKILKKAIRGLYGSAGGHEAAGGFTLDYKKWDELRERILNIVNS